MNHPFRFARLNSLALTAALSFCGLAGYAADTLELLQSVPVMTATNTAATQEPYTNTAIVPRLNPRFMAQHTNFVAIAEKGDIDVLFMGDSITDWWRMAPTNGGRDVFANYFGALKVANFGIAGDTTQGVLWRLQNGEGKGYKPKAIMLMLGTNNTGGRRGGGNTSTEIAEGVEAVIAEMRKDFPGAKILLLGIFPRDNPGDVSRKKISEINQRISKLHDGKQIVYMDISNKFLDADGNFLPGVFRTDKLHPVEKGYEIWAQAVKEPLAKLMQ